METLKVIIISIVQGITEFLPVSSSGHILLLKNLLNLEIDMTFDIAIHMGTLIAVVIFFRKEIMELIKGVFADKIESQLFKATLYRKDVLKIWGLFIVATIPGGLAGLFLEKRLDWTPSTMPGVFFFILAALFLATGGFLLLTLVIKRKKTTDIVNMNFLQAFFIGCFQALAILPGISRSGSTISASLYSGLNKEDTGRFSFLLSIPLILAAFLLKVVKMFENRMIYDFQYIFNLVIGLIVSAIIGYISLKCLISMIRKGKIWFFSLYLIVPITISVILGVLK